MNNKVLENNQSSREKKLKQNFPLRALSEGKGKPKDH